jgi:hypothetical protein
VQNKETSTELLTLLSHQAGSKYMAVPSVSSADHFVMDKRNTVQTEPLNILIKQSIVT